MATGLAGCLGTLTGVQATVTKATTFLHFLMGLRESLHNMVAAFVIITIACLLVTAGSYRLVRRSEKMEAAELANG